MAVVYLIRHGRASASFTDDLDPGLDELGRTQADAAARLLAERTPLALRSSPLKRAWETATPLADLLSQQVAIEERFAEIPSPGMTLAERGPWLRTVMSGRWSEQAPELAAWREALIDCLREIQVDTAIFSHFIAINAAVGAAEGDDRVTVFKPDNGSITRIEINDGELSLLERGDEAETRVN